MFDSLRADVWLMVQYRTSNVDVVVVRECCSGAAFYLESCSDANQLCFSSVEQPGQGSTFASRLAPSPVHTHDSIVVPSLLSSPIGPPSCAFLISRVQQPLLYHHVPPFSLLAPTFFYLLFLHSLDCFARDRRGASIMWTYVSSIHRGPAPVAFLTSRSPGRMETALANWNTTLPALLLLLLLLLRLLPFLPGEFI